jgi:hypothetical protein
MRIAYDGSGTWRPSVITANFAIDPNRKYTLRSLIKAVGTMTESMHMQIIQFKADGTSFATATPGLTITQIWPVTLTNGTAVEHELVFQSYPDAAFAKIAFRANADFASPAASPDGISGKFILVDDVLLVKEDGISNIQYRSRPFTKDGINIETLTVAPKYVLDYIMFTRPEDNSAADDHMDGRISYLTNGGGTFASRSRIMEINSGGYRGPSTSFNDAFIKLSSGNVGEERSESDILLTAGYFQFGIGTNTIKVFNNAATAPHFRYNDGAVYSAVPWISVTFLGTWANYGSSYEQVQYRLVGDQVQIRGMAAGGTLGSSMFTLPVGYRPPEHLLFPTDTSAAHGRIDVLSTGSVVPNGTANTFVAVNVSFSITA